MKNILISIVVCFIGTANATAQTDSLIAGQKPTFKITFEPGIGISPMPLLDMSISNIVQVNITKRLNAISYSSFRQNNLFIRNFNYIETTNNYMITQKFGIGSCFYAKRSIHTVSFLAGVKYDTYHESLNNPKFEKVDVTIKSWSPDFGIIYGMKVGKGKYFFSPRVYIPLYPYPIKTTDINASDANLANISFEFGVGVRLR